MKIHILFGTESGNSEMVATDLQEAWDDAHDVELDDLADFDPGSFDAETLYLVICSTHGEGEPPQSAVPFIERMQAVRPDLSGVRYAMFGLGDRTYPDYSRGSEHIDSLLADSGAERVGAYGRHDASSRDDASELVQQWAQDALSAAFAPETSRA